MRLGATRLAALGTPEPPSNGAGATVPEPSDRLVCAPPAGVAGAADALVKKDVITLDVPSDPGSSRKFVALSAK